jgi:proprotein convertase subtilisin/kexin type 5
MLGCTECSGATTCTKCDSTQMFTLSGSDCVCLGGYYLSGGTVCSECSVPLLGCLDCTDASTCTNCDSSLQMELLSGATQCTCIAGYYLSGSTCTLCPNGCTTCTAVACTSCDTAGGFGQNGTSCDCISSKYLEVNNTCQNCGTKFDYCTECTITGCTGCTAPTVPSGGTCVCGPGYYNNTLNCDLC